MLGSLTVALYLVSRCLEQVMGQVLARLAPDWRGATDGPSAADAPGQDECGGRLHAPARGLHRVALHDDEEMVIREKVENGTRQEHHSEAVLLEHQPNGVLLVQPAEPAGQVLPVKRPPPPAVEQTEPKRRLPAELGTLIRCQYSFLDDPETVDYLRTSKVLFVLRGLPGCGKSYLADKIATTYPGTVLCSADHFFMKDASYQFDREQLSAAHESCKQRAEHACLEQRSHIVVDNTNLRYWEWSEYAKLAARHHYLVLVQEPATAWRRDPHRLAITNCHGVTEQEIRKKLKSIQEPVPKYYGWFLNAADCRDLLDRVWSLLQTMHRASDQFREELTLMTGSDNISDLGSLYQPPAELLHCTAFFCGGRARAAAGRQYGERAEVRRALGALSTARLTAVLITPRTVCGRVTLDAEQLALWHQSDREAGPPPPARPERPRPPPAGWQVGAAQPSLAVSGSKRPARTECGRRAHVTLGCRPGWPPVTAGCDLLAALDRLEASPELLRRPPAAAAGRAALHRLGEQLWYLDLDRDMVVDVIFSGRY
ncbi:2',3'-cyclic-nucleotide 3'-phosphodiesterase-like [Amphibalanus amphitrite]|uniref:2',3'-cyclic-nucleotide 3'-phosphodiesterase-like n=1 Tax=Amphibalanus amphitrite TaxID=1232801 RepID=UPI001C9115E1|nr:2',3'-cyclic-nucleotide 3'-phosphodiesterase-like [Amphibalanus amphitrite]XP_043229506.1 2',3'-cyclic-nucleotide 3'-phosphodiesterase-like [Amphibalanus amphitrite]